MGVGRTDGRMETMTSPYHIVWRRAYKNRFIMAFKGDFWGNRASLMYNQQNRIKKNIPRVIQMPLIQNRYIHISNIMWEIGHVTRGGGRWCCSGQNIIYLNQWLKTFLESYLAMVAWKLIKFSHSPEMSCIIMSRWLLWHLWSIKCSFCVFFTHFKKLQHI